MNPFDWAREGSETSGTRVYHLCSMRWTLPSEACKEIVSLLAEAWDYYGGDDRQREARATAAKYDVVEGAVKFVEVEVSSF